MKKILWIVSIVSMLVASYEFLEERTEETILFTVWSFYLKYLSNKSE